MSDEQIREIAPTRAGGDLDPQLLDLFAAEQPTQLADAAFSRGVMRRVQRHQRWLLLGRVAGGLLLALLAVPLQDPLELLSEALLVPLLEGQGVVGRELLSPLSSAGALLAVALLGLQLLFRRLLR